MKECRFKRELVLLVALAPFALAGCTVKDVDWGYAGKTGPENWGRIDKHYSACSAGSQQSPLDMTGAINAEMADLVIDWEKGGEMENTGHTIQVNAAPGGTLRRGDKTYELVQYHFHAPSEHVVKGQHFPMEVHFVHKDAETGVLGVLAVFVKAGTANRAFTELAAAFPGKVSGETLVGDVDPSALLPSELAYWSYEGSLTTPPCSENVDWMLAMEPIEVDEQDIAKFTAIYSMNARPVRAANRRYILGSR